MWDLADLIDSEKRERERENESEIVLIKSTQCLGLMVATQDSAFY